jgi:hypothetical protein
VGRWVDEGRCIDSPPLPDIDEEDEEDERGVIGENFCHPPLLLPPWRTLEFPRDVEPCAGRSKPRVEPAAPPGLPDCCPPITLAVSRPFATARFELAAALPRDEKNCWFRAAFRVVDAAAARPLAE